MGLFDVDNKWFFGGMFDFNHDGKTSWSEQFMAHKMFEEGAKEQNNNNFYSNTFDSDTRHTRWKARSKSETTVSVPVSIEVSFPALNKKEDIKEEDYPNKRQYNAACALAGTIIYCDEECEREKKAICNFILNKSSELVAARYLTASGDFLYAQAIKDNFDLPITLLDEDEKREYFFRDILKKLARKDIPLCFEVWSWCLDNFLKYSEYDSFSKATLTNRIIDDLYDFPDEFEPALIKYLSSHPDFRKSVIREADEVSGKLSKLIIDAIKLDLHDTAKLLFEDGLVKADRKWQPINKLMSDTILFAENYDELETIEYIEQNLLPLVKAYPDGMIAGEIETWERDIAEYKLDVEKRCDKYVYLREGKDRKALRKGNNKETKAVNISQQLDDKAVYTYCGVLLPFSSRPYFFRTDKDDIEIGDRVLVSVGSDNKETEGVVVSIGKYLRIGAPFPVEKAKFIIKKVVPEEK